MQSEHQPQPGRERRKEPRLPEELLAVMTDNVAAAEAISAMPEEEVQQGAQFVAEGTGRADRARRAVDVVRSAVSPKRKGRSA